MAPTRNVIALAVALVVMTWHGALAQSTCTNAVMSLAPCFNFVTGTSSGGPTSSCCSQLNWVIQNQPECLCTIMNGGGAALGLGAMASQTMGLTLPGACSLQSPSVSQCNVANGPTASVTSSASAPSGSTPTDDSTVDIPNSIAPSTPSQTTTPSSTGAGSKTVPLTNNASSATTIALCHFSVAIFLFGVSFNLIY